jgi:hypothetical protein
MKYTNMKSIRNFEGTSQMKQDKDYQNCFKTYCTLKLIL